MQLAVAIPSRERPKRLHDTLISMLQDTHSIDGIGVWVRVDDDEPLWDEYRGQICYEHWDNTVFFRKGPTGKYIGLINELHKSMPKTYDAFMCGTDDIIFQDKGWFETLEKLNSQTKWYVAWFNDGEKYEECAQVPIISKSVVDVLGEPLYNKLGHFYGDLWITMLAKHCGIAYYIPTHRIFHMTPKNGRVKGMDSTFIRVRLGEQIVKDHKIFSDSSDDLTQAANKLKEAMKNG